MKNGALQARHCSSFSKDSLKPRSYLKNSWTHLRSSRFAFFGLCLLALLLFCAIFFPLFSSHTYYETHLSLKNTPPCKDFWFGTDELGRDLFIRVWWGARISIFVGITAALIDMIIGVIYGALAGLVGGKIEELMMRLTDVLYSLPYLLVVILLMELMKPGLTAIILALTLTGWINMARIVRAEILKIKQNDFVIAALMFGATKWRLLFRHLIPNAIGSIITTMTLTIPTAIFAEAFLSFLGLGIPPPTPSWGAMINDGFLAVFYYPWRLLFPGGFISITMLSFNLLGDGIRDAFDPRLH